MLFGNSLLLVLVSLLHCLYLVNSQGSCSTPDSRTGKCIPLKQCPQLVALLHTKPLTDIVTQQLRKYQCGSGGSNVQVCCPETSGPKPVGLFGEPLPTDISKHKNLNLLNTFPCGNVLMGDRYVGNKTSVGEFPWVALISYNKPSGTISYDCLGSLINKNYILTAAQCLTNLGGKTLANVRLGEYNIRTNPDCDSIDIEECAPLVQDVAIEQSIAHPRFDPIKMQNDIGLIRLKTPAKIDESFVFPICLPLTIKNLVQLQVGHTFRTAGWRMMNDGSMNNELIRGFLPYIFLDDCKKRYQGTKYVLNHMQICACQHKNYNLYGGDTGGPLQSFYASGGDLKYIQDGIVSIKPTSQSADNVIPGVYTRVIYYMDWILDNIKP